MKFTLPKSDLNEIIAQIQSVVPNRPALPILSNFVIDAKEEGLTLMATDMTVTLKSFFPMKVDQTGSTTLPSKRLFQLIRELTSKEVNFEVSENNICKVQSQSSQFKINGMDKSQFPNMPDFENSTKIHIETNTLKNMILQTSFCASRDENRYLMTGLLFKIEHGHLMIVGTDARRLAKIEVPISVDPSFQKQYIVPIRGIEEISKMLERTNDEQVSLYLSEDRIGIETTNSLLSTKLLVGDFPDFKSVIPTNYNHEVHLHREELISLLKQIAIFAGDMGAASFLLENGELKITSSNHELGEAVVTMPVNYTQPPFEIYFNPVHILDVLRHLTSETIKMGLVDSLNPATLQDEKSALYIVMPMRKQ